jgi:hypothetical protein
MSSVHSEVPMAKALIGAIFIQYVVYAALYIIEGIKVDESDDKQTTTSGTAAPAQAKPEESKEENDNKQ